MGMNFNWQFPIWKLERFYNSDYGVFERRCTEKWKAASGVYKGLAAWKCRRSGEAVWGISEENYQHTRYFCETPIKRELLSWDFIGNFRIFRISGQFSLTESRRWLSDILVEIEDEELGIIIEVKYAQNGDLETGICNAWHR